LYELETATLIKHSLDNGSQNNTQTNPRKPPQK